MCKKKILKLITVKMLKNLKKFKINNFLKTWQYSNLLYIKNYILEIIN